MKNILKCVNKDCGHKEPMSGTDINNIELTRKGIVITERGDMVLCPICNCRTILIDDR